MKTVYVKFSDGKVREFTGRSTVMDGFGFLLITTKDAEYLFKDWVSCESYTIKDKPKQDTNQPMLPFMEEK